MALLGLLKKTDAFHSVHQIPLIALALLPFPGNNIFEDCLRYFLGELSSGYPGFQMPLEKRTNGTSGSSTTKS